MVAVMVVASVVNALLLAATGLLSEEKPNLPGILGGGLLWGIYTVLSMAFDFGSDAGRICALVLSALVAFRFDGGLLRKIPIFLILHLSVTGMTQSERIPSLILCVLGITAVCLLGSKGKNLIPVELSYGGKTLSLTALRDTGNTLRDPVTGRQVLIVGADIAGKLTGLTQEELQNPVNTIGTIPGLRLIPYKTIGNTGFLLALKIPEAKIGNRQGSTIVAFSPLILGSNYQALTGGTV